MKKLLPIILLLCVTLSACGKGGGEPKNGGGGAGNVTASGEPSRTAETLSSAPGTPTPAPEPFALYPAYLQLPLGQHVTLDADSAPAGGKLVWSSSDTSVAVVDENGRVTPVAEGEAIITAAADGVTAACGALVTAEGNVFMWEYPLTPEDIEALKAAAPAPAAE